MNDKITKIQKGIQLANIEIIKLREENTGILKKNAILEKEQRKSQLENFQEEVQALKVQVGNYKENIRELEDKIELKQPRQEPSEQLKEMKENFENAEKMNSLKSELNLEKRERRDLIEQLEDLKAENLSLKQKGDEFSKLHTSQTKRFACYKKETVIYFKNQMNDLRTDMEIKAQKFAQL